MDYCVPLLSGKATPLDAHTAYACGQIRGMLPVKTATAGGRQLEALGAILYALYQSHALNVPIRMSKRADAYTMPKRYSAHWNKRRTVNPLLEELQRLGFIRMDVGGMAYVGNGKTEYSHTYIRPTPLLAAYFPLSFDFELKEVLVLKKKKVRRDAKTKKVLLDERGKPITHKVKVDYRDTKETKQLKSFIESYNEFAKGFDVTLDGKKLNVSVRRIYQDNFRTGGRFYSNVTDCGMTAADRARIKINGEDTVEPDYDAHHLTIAYMIQGEQLPKVNTYNGIVLPDGSRYKGDLYNLIAEQVTSPEHVKSLRAVSKILVMMMLNNETREEAEGSFYAEVARCEKAATPNAKQKKFLASVAAMTSLKLSIPDMYNATRKAHPRIPFGLIPWGELQYADSKIMETVLATLQHEGILGIGIHDSVIVQKQHEEYVEKVMNHARRASPFYI